MDNDYLIKILNEKIESLEAELEKATSEKNKLLGSDSDHEEGHDYNESKRSYRWTKMILESLLRIDDLVPTDDLYEHVYNENESTKVLKRNKRISSLSGAMITLRKNGSIKYIEDSIGTKLYGLSEFFNVDGIPKSQYLVKMKYNGYDLSRFFGSDISIINVDTDQELNNANEIVGKKTEVKDLDDLPF